MGSYFDRNEHSQVGTKAQFYLNIEEAFVHKTVHILTKENLTPSAQEIEEEYEKAMEGVRQIQRQGEVNEDGVREQVVQSLETQIVMDWLSTNCEVTKLPYQG